MLVPNPNTQIGLIISGTLALPSIDSRRSMDELTIARSINPVHIRKSKIASEITLKTKNWEL